MDKVVPTINENQMYYELNHIIFLSKEMLDFCFMETDKKNNLTKIIDSFYNSFIIIADEFEYQNPNSLY